jgi:hypothetical protein
MINWVLFMIVPFREFKLIRISAHFRIRYALAFAHNERIVSHLTSSRLA